MSKHDCDPKRQPAGVQTLSLKLPRRQPVPFVLVNTSPVSPVP